MSNYSKLAVLGLLAVSLTAQTPAQPAAPTPALEPGLYATINTTMGDITLKLFEKEAPVTVRNFIDLQLGRKAWRNPKTGAMVHQPLYTGTTFHRVIPRFMIQGGDPAGDGTGNVGFTIKDEFVPTLRFDQPGRLAMANIGEPNTGACQFFITVVPTTFLNDKHTIFGQVAQGQDVVEKIVSVPRNRDDKPLKPVAIKNITFKREGAAPADDPLAARRPAAKKAAPKKAAPAK